MVLIDSVSVSKTTKKGAEPKWPKISLFNPLSDSTGKHIFTFYLHIIFLLIFLIPHLFKVYASEKSTDTFFHGISILF